MRVVQLKKMSSGARVRWATMAAFAVCVGVAAPAGTLVTVLEAQVQNGSALPAQQSGSQQVPGLGKGITDDSPFSRQAQEQQVKARNNERQKRLEADTDKLLALATQLHEDVARTDKNILSVDVIRRSQEIEKLAHDIKERMKG